MGYEITMREEHWGAMHELRLTGDSRPVASVTIDPSPLFGEPRRPAVNWSAIGAQPPEVTRDFAAGLLELAAIAEKHIPKTKKDIPKLASAL